jgi:hypothetical protein
MTTATLIEALRQQTSIMSSVASMQRTMAYQDLRKRGYDIVGELLVQLNDEKAPAVAIMALLHDITKATPEVAKVDRGKVAVQIKAWLEWGRKYNLLPKTSN